MPAAGIHLCIAKKLLKKRNMDQQLFFLGNVAPDSWRNSNSTKDGTHFQIDGIIHHELFYQKYKNELSNPFVYGYLTHLITDFYWYGHHLSTSDKKVENYYEECSKLVSKLTKIYQIKPLEKIKDDFFHPIEELETSGINQTIQYINNVSFLDDSLPLVLFNVEDTIHDIDETYEYVERELERLKISKIY